MYGPQGRGRVLLMVLGTLFLFSGALASPLLFPDDVVRLRFGEDDGFATQGGPLQLNTAEGMRVPRALVTTPTTSSEAAFQVGWDNDGPDVSLVYAFHVQYAAVGVGSEDEVSWEDWFRLRRSDLPRTATFTGVPGEEYAFRARTCDLAVFCGPWSEATATQVLPTAEAPLVDLKIMLKSPAAEDRLEGRVALAWDYEHQGPGTALVEVVARPETATEWSPLYSGSALSVVWDTTQHEDGKYVVRLRVSDGVHHVDEEVPLQVANHASAPVEVLDEDEPTEEQDVEKETKESSAALPLWSLATLFVAVASLRRRSG